MWNSLELAKLVVGIMTPVTVLFIGWGLNRRIKRLDQIVWTNQKVIEKRITLFDELAPRLNRLLCFYTWVGYWKSISPKDVLDAKRELDKTVNIYRSILGEPLYGQYHAFIHLLFQTYSGAGRDALIRTAIRGGNGDRTTDAAYTWDAQWNDSFTPDTDCPSSSEIYDRYRALLEAFADAIGIRHAA